MNMSNMREISIEECNAVFGGTITVNGNPPVAPKTSGWIDPQLLSSLMGGSYGGYLRTQALILATQAAPDVALDEGHVDEGDDDGDKDVIVVLGLDPSKLATMRDHANWMAPILMGLVVVGTGSWGVSAGKYTLQILTSLVGSKEASAIVAAVTSAGGEQYAQQLLADKLYKGMRDRYIQDMADDGVYNQSWRALD
jgi:hypothetical protein